MSSELTKKANPPAKGSRKWNAMKHEAYSGTTLLPWESPQELDELRRAYWADLQPEGPLQEACVETIVISEWRKARVRFKRKLELEAALDKVENRFLAEEPPPLFDTRREALTLLDLAGVAIALAQQDRGRRVSVGDRFDRHNCVTTNEKKQLNFRHLHGYISLATFRKAPPNS